MKKNYLLIVLSFLACVSVQKVFAQNPGLLISEFLQNPSGSDVNLEYVELLATDDIDFSSTPYTVIVTNNGTATANGWVEGGSITYAFEISSGSVSTGDVVYVGGSLMTPTGTILRQIDIENNGGDGGIGNATTDGVFGNGGGNADGIAVFNLAVASITSSSVPTDAVFYGSGAGDAVVNGGTDGYELPNNDLYNGGKLNGSSTIAPDEDLTIATGTFDLSTNTFTVARTFAEGTHTTTSEISFGSVAPLQIEFEENNITVDENSNEITVLVTLGNTSTEEASFDLAVAPFSTAEETDDYTISTLSFTVDAGETEDVEVIINIEDDAIEEQSEYITLYFSNLTNAEVNGNKSITVYISDNDRVLAEATNEIKLELLSSFSNGEEDLSSAEITAFDPESSKLFIANSVANTIDFVNFDDPTALALESSYNVDSIGSVNSITAYDGVVIVALENLDPQQNGYLLFLDTDGNWLNRVEVGPMPDMVTLNHAKDKIIVANEGEPNDDYTVDPEGSVSVISYTGEPSEITSADITMIDFNDYDGQEATLIDEGVRIFGPNASASQDFEPEYITVSGDDSFAYVSLQENNALAVIDLSDNTVSDILPLGTIDHSLFGYGMDVSNETDGINIANFPVKGMFMPDAISTIDIDGETYILSANEGDARDYDGFSEEERVKDLDLDETIFPNADLLQQDEVLGRLKTTTVNGDTDDDGDYDEIYSYGTRSFSIWNASGERVFDSGDLFEQILSNDPVFVDLFNASNTSLSQKNRSDDKGPEPEGVETTYINGTPFAFVSLERIGGVMLFNISNPINPIYLGYYNNRDLATNGPDKGAEGLLYISAEDAPNGNPLLILSNEVSSSLTVFEVQTCIALSDLVIDDEETSFCEGTSLELTSSSEGTLSYQWLVDGTEIPGAENASLTVDEPGSYTVHFTNSDESCEGTTEAIEVTELSNPTPTITEVSGDLSTEEFDSYTWFFDGSELTSSDSQTWSPEDNGFYTVEVVDSNGCVGTSEPFEIEGLSTITVNQQAFVIAPNPANQLVTINAKEDFKVTMYNSLGAVILSNKSFNGECKLSVEDVPSGVYFVHIHSNVGTEVAKLVVKH